jgi:Fasciclin domain
VAAVVAGCGGSDRPAQRPAATVAATVIGPLCDALPSGDDPGAPATLADEPPEVALQWIPVVTTFEAAVRASRMGNELRDVTILAPTDDAFVKAFDRQRLDDVLLSRGRQLRALVEAHVVDGERSLAELLEAGEVTTRAATRLVVTSVDGGMRLEADDDGSDGPERRGGRARTVCADYAVAGARIHVIDAVLSS